MQISTEERIEKGKPVTIEVVTIDENEIVVKGKLIKIARLKEEWDKDIEDPVSITEKLKLSALKVDIFTFMQRLPESKPKYNYNMEWENVAAIPIKNFDHWWGEQINQSARNKIRKAKKEGVIVKLVDFNDELIKGISNIYNEIPIRQGRPFWNYGTDLDFARKENSPFLDRADFVGAYYGQELIGFIRIVYTDRFARTMGILCKIKCRDKAPMNALVAKAVEVCVQKKIPYLLYAKYNYGKLGSNSLMNFKRQNGFEGIILPRYYIPLTYKGRVALKFNLNHGIIELIPRKILRYLLGLRNKWYNRKIIRNQL